MQELIEQLEISGCMVVVDARNCQKKTAEMVIKVIKGKADYLLCAKDQKNLKKNIETYIQDEPLQKSMGKEIKTEKNGRIEKRTAYVIKDVDWLEDKKEWKGLNYIGTIHAEFEERDKKQVNGITISVAET